MVKQVIVVRKDLKKMMKHKGKLGAQIGHAVLAPIKKEMERINQGFWNGWYDMILHIDCNSPMDEWWNGEFTKIVLAVSSLDELLDLHDKLIDNGINAVLITDNAHTVFDEPTVTCLGIFPMEAEVIDKFTGHLPLL